MSLESLRRILDELKRVGEPVEYVMFSAMGEPFLYPHLREACEMVKEAGFTVVVTTNGSLLKNSHKTLPIDRLYLSFRSTGASSFYHRKAKISFDHYLQILANFLDGNTQKTIVYFAFNDNVLWRQQYEKNWMDVIDYTEKDKLLESFNTFGSKLCPEFKPLSEVPPMDSFIHIREGLDIFFTRIYSWSNVILPPGYAVLLADRIDYCDYNERHIVIYATGEVTTCCMDYNGELVIGNIYKEPLDLILSRRPPHEKLTRHLFCRRCKGRVIKPSA